MTPWRNRDARQPRVPQPPDDPSDAEIVAWAAAAPNAPASLDVVLDALMIRYLENDLSAADRHIVEERRRTDPKFCSRAEQLTRLYNLPEDADEDERAEKYVVFSDIMERIAYERQSIRILESYKRRLYPRRHARTPWLAQPVDPDEFVKCLAAELGTDTVDELVMAAFAIVSIAGEPDRWISEVARARDAGVISADVAHFLIWQLARSAMRALVAADPELSRMSAEIEVIERERGLEDGDLWYGHAPAPRWCRRLCQEWWAALDEQVIHVLVRNGEFVIAEAYVADDQGAYVSGYTEIFDV